MTLVKVNNQFARSIDGMMKDILNEFPSAVSKTFREDVLHFPPVNIHEGENSYQLEMAAPGFEKADFKINLENDVLTISTEKKEENVSENTKVVRKEFSYKAIKRSFTIDEKIDSDKISARYENGVLKVDLPKKAEIKPATKSITIQ